MPRSKKNKKALLSDAAPCRQGCPLFGRINSTIPFMPFNELEQAVATYKFMRQFRNDKSSLVNVELNKMFNHFDDGEISSRLASEYYHLETGARSVERTVECKIIWAPGDCFRAGDEEITDEMNERPLERYEVRLSTENEMQPETRAGVASIQRRGEEVAESRQYISVVGFWAFW